MTASATGRLAMGLPVAFPVTPALGVVPTVRPVLEGVPQGRTWHDGSGLYIVLEASPDVIGPYDRHRAGLNHLALRAESREVLDGQRNDCREHSWSELFAERYPHAGGPQHTALFLVNSEGFELELVADESVELDADSGEDADSVEGSDGGPPVAVQRIMADLVVRDLDPSEEFLAGVLGMRRQDMGLDWVTRFVSPTGAAIQVLTRDASGSPDPEVSVGVDDVDAAYARAQRLGHEIVRPLTEEPWGVRRFFVRMPDGHVINVLRHRS